MNSFINFDDLWVVYDIDDVRYIGIALIYCEINEKLIGQGKRAICLIGAEAY